MQLQEAFRDQVAMVGSVENLMVVCWEGTPEVAHIEAMAETFRRARSAHPTGVATVALVRGGIPSFSEDVRRAANGLAQTTQKGALGTVFVILPHGMLAATVRAFLSGIFLAARSKEPLKVVATIPEASEWLLGVLGDTVPWTRERISEVLEPYARASW